ncbi:MAG: hypothetical protein OHK0047_29970 [Leptolyngbyaceae cyanobacterium]|uniref:DUF2721 domain-containing protein n=1 Tax=Leptodesmis sichuanensis TaxID=2906798 RepID=UPI001F45FF0D|nr:DUF2721 domain-containing protein [Leptodesmis sichuanensis]UIE37651.1 DUF2721 domain-containing protein [Leptodesmis sichuanensis A121]
MSVEQTTQLIQLMLNSMLMGVVCALVLGGLTARHSTLSEEIQALQQAGVQETNREAVRSQVSRRQQRYFHTRYRIMGYGVMMAYYALLFSILSGFLLALRGLFGWDWLVPVALALFAIGISTLLVAVGLTLIEWHLSNRPLLDEAGNLLSMGHMEQRHGRSRPVSRRPALATRRIRGSSVPTNNHRMRVG